MLRSSLCDYSDAYILVSGIIAFIRGPNDAIDANKRANEKIKEQYLKIVLHLLAA